MRKHQFFSSTLALLAFIESFYIYIEPIPRKGLELMFLLPMMFGLCILYFGKKIIPYHENGLGLKIYYSVTFIRFIAQPLLIILSDGKLNFRMPEARPDSYSVAILIYCIEIVVACIAINKWYPHFVKKYQRKERVGSSTPLNHYGTAVIIVYLLFLFARIGSWFPGMKILGIKEATSDIAVVFDATVFNCVKVFIFIYFIVKSRANLKDPFKFRLYFTLAVAAGLFNFLTYFGNNRSFIYETAIATISILVFMYPRYRKRIFVISVPLALLVMTVSFVTKQFAAENVMEFVSVDNATATSNIVEEYANGLWTVARSYQASLGLAPSTSAEAFLKDVSDGFTALSDLPGFKTINESLAELKSSSDIFKNSLRQEGDRGQMLSLSGGFLIVGGELLGWIILLIGNYLMIMLLVYMEVKSKLTQDIYYKYMYIWMSILMGLVHCYCLQTIIFCWSKFILFYWIVLYINRFAAFNRLSPRARGLQSNIRF